MSTTKLLHFTTVILNSQDLYSIHRSESGNWLDENRSSFLYSKMHKSGSPILRVQGALFCGKYQDPPRDLWKKKSTTSVGSWRFQKQTSCVILFPNNKYLSIHTMVTGRFSEISIQFCQTKWSQDDGLLQLLPNTDFKLQPHTSFLTLRNRANQRDMPRARDSHFFTVGHPNFFEWMG